MNPNKVIILAGGLSSRLYPITNNMPKCMLSINDKTIIQRQLDVFAEFSINDIVVVTGYCKEIIVNNHTDLKFIDDSEYKVPGIVRGLFCAEKEMDGGFIFSYSDIVFSRDILEKLLEIEGDIVLTVDTDWEKHYEGRIKHPLPEAELVKAKNRKVVKIGKDVVKINEAQGEFIGLAKFTDKGTKIIKEVYHDLLSKYKKEDPFQNAKEFQRAYLTDFIQELVNRNIEIKTANINSVWTEIDTDEDLERAKKIWK
jgi:L-glutamine-phosphate cytidylyltransferase